MSRDIEVGLRVPHELLNGPGTGVAGFASAVDASGLTRVTVGDHVSFHSGQGYDGLVHATALAALTRRVSIRTAVYLLPLRPPVPVARQVVSVALLAPGRFEFGVGVGGDDPAEYDRCGIDVHQRGRRMDECLTAVRGLIRGEEVETTGDHVIIPSTRIEPRLTHEVPILVGGRSKAALRRVAHTADGWIGVFVSPNRFASATAEITEMAAAAGRSEPPREHSMVVWCGVGTNAEDARDRVARKMEELYRRPFPDFERYVPYGTPIEIARKLHPYVASEARSFDLITVAETSGSAIEAADEIRMALTSET